MSKIFYVIGKSSTGKDTIYQRIMNDSSISLQRIVPYTTRPIREGELEGGAYHFRTEDQLKELQDKGQVIECRAYNTIHGIWYYFTVKDEHLNLEQNDYMMIGTLESFQSLRKFFGEEDVVPIYIEVSDKDRITRALERENREDNPKYEEMCRRFLADNQDFSEEKLKEAGIQRRFYNDNLDTCIQEIEEFIRSFR